MPWDYKGIGEAKFFMSPIDSTHSPNFLFFRLHAKFISVQKISLYHKNKSVVCLLMINLRNQIRQVYELSDVQHITHLDNLKDILTDGCIFSKNQMLNLGKQSKDISNESVQTGRANITIPCSGKPLHDYVPLYWGKKTPMVSSLRKINDSLLFLIFSTELLSKYDCLISDGNARSTKTQFKKFSQLNDLDILDCKSINTSKYAHDDEIKRRKQSELLVLNKLPLHHLLRIICYSQAVKNKVETLLATHCTTCSVYVGLGNYYYMDNQ